MASPIGIVGHAILPHQLDVFGHLVGLAVIPTLQSSLDGSQIHLLFDNLGIIKELQALPIDGFGKGSTIFTRDEPIDNLGDPFHWLLLTGQGRHGSRCVLMGVSC